MKRHGPIQVGVFGAGANSRLHHIPKLQAIDGVSVVGVCNRSRESGDRVADAFGIARVYATWQEMVADAAIDAVVIGTWPNMHCPVTVGALAAGKHVLCEARMAMNASQARDMLDMASRHPHLVAQVVPSPFTLRFDRTLRRQVAEGAVGQLLAIDINACTGAFPDLEARMTWRQDIALSGLNTMTLGIWYEAMARWVGHATRVSAFGRVFTERRVDAEGQMRKVEIPDHLDVLADLACGAQAHLRVSAVTGACPHPWTAHLYGTEGTLRLDVENDRLLTKRPGHTSWEVVPIPPEEAQHWRVEEEFIGAIRGEEEVRLTTFAEGVRYMQFTEAVARSREEGQAIELPLGD